MGVRERALMRSIQQAGGVDLLPIIDGPRIEKFEPSILAAALEHEIARAKREGWSKISLHMDVVDAQSLARHLTRSR